MLPVCPWDMKLLTLEWSLAGTRWWLFPWNLSPGTTFGSRLSKSGCISCSRLSRRAEGSLGFLGIFWMSAGRWPAGRSFF